MMMTQRSYLKIYFLHDFFATTFFTFFAAAGDFTAFALVTFPAFGDAATFFGDDFGLLAFGDAAAFFDFPVAAAAFFALAIISK
jgi:hypothetical protein